MNIDTDEDRRPLGPAGLQRLRKFIEDAIRKDPEAYLDHVAHLFEELDRERTEIERLRCVNMNLRKMGFVSISMEDMEVLSPAVPSARDQELIEAKKQCEDTMRQVADLKASLTILRRDVT